MAVLRNIRRAAFQALFQIDATRATDDATLAESVRGGAELSDSQVSRAIELARSAFDDRARADDVFALLAPDWPARRMAAVDRAVLRLAHFEMTSGRVPPKVAVNEAVELAKTFGGEKSPTFVNGLLDRVLRGMPEHAAPMADPQQGEE
ncbi:MAG: transcription antitermination factor NusB [Planctomycetota bacterium]